MTIQDRLFSPKKNGEPQNETTNQNKSRDFPWWMIAIGILILAVFLLIQTNENYRDAFVIIREGLGVTISTTLIAYSIAMVIGLVVGLGMVSESAFWRNVATIYVEIIRGVPLLVLIFFIALVLIPGVISLINTLGGALLSIGWESIGQQFSELDIRSVSMNTRAIISLAITYGAFLAEVFRAGIQSINKGQMEAARSQGMNHWQAMRYVILPQAIRNVFPALGNDLISMLKDSSLVSILAVRDITQITRLFTGHSFMFTEAYTILCVLYLTLTLILSFILKFLERRIGTDGK